MADDTNTPATSSTKATAAEPKIMTPEEETALQEKLEASRAARAAEERKARTVEMKPVTDLIYDERTLWVIDQIKHLPFNFDADNEVGPSVRALRSFAPVLERMPELPSLRKG